MVHVGTVCWKFANKGATQKTKTSTSLLGRVEPVNIVVRGEPSQMHLLFPLLLASNSSEFSSFRVIVAFVKCPVYSTGARLSFAIKMSPSKEIALRKSTMMDVEVLRDALEILQGNEAEELKTIIHEIEEGKLDREAIFKAVEKYETQLELQRKHLVP